MPYSKPFSRWCASASIRICVLGCGKRARVAFLNWGVLSRGSSKTMTPCMLLCVCLGGKRITEGKVNKLKTLKRVMYGRAGFPLLRQRLLHDA